MKIKFEWEEIYHNSKSSTRSYLEYTYRAKVIGGWILKHDTYMDYQYMCMDDCEENYSHRHIDEEGWQNINCTLAFISDPEHKWEIE